MILFPRKQVYLDVDGLSIKRTVKSCLDFDRDDQSSYN